MDIFKDSSLNSSFAKRIEDIRREVHALVENLFQYKYFNKQYKQKHLRLVDIHFFKFVSMIWYESMCIRLNKLNDKDYQTYSFYITLEKLTEEFIKNPINLKYYNKIYHGTTSKITSYFFKKNGELNIKKIVLDKIKLSETIKNISAEAADKVFRHMDPKYSGDKIAELELTLLDVKKGVSLVKKYAGYYYPFLTGKSFSFEPQKPRWGLLFRNSKEVNKIRMQTNNRETSRKLKKVINTVYAHEDK